MIQPRIRSAIDTDVRQILALVRELAEFEKLSDEAVATEDNLRDALFGENPKVFCDIAEGAGGRIIGLSVWFYTFSTFKGRHGIWIEDLFVRPDYRRNGAGQMLLAECARRCVAENLGRLEWSVLDWNAGAIDFYKAQGADLLSDWRICRVADSALWRLADHAR